MTDDEAPPSSQDNGLHIAWGGKVTLLDWIFWPGLGAISLIALVEAVPLAIGWIVVVIGAGAAVLLLLIASLAAFKPQAWVEGSRYQLSLMLLGFVAETVSTFAGAFALLSRGDARHFTEPLDGPTALYVSAATWVSGSSGLVNPVSTLARFLTVFEMYVSLATILVVLSTAVGAAFANRK